MRCLLGKLFSLGLLFSSTVVPGAAEPVEPWLEWHYVGAKALKEHPDAITVREIFRLPESKRLSEILIAKLARTPEKHVFGPQSLTPPARLRLLKLLLADMLQFESTGALAGPLDETMTLSLGIKLPGPKVDEWDRMFRRYLGMLGWPAPDQDSETEGVSWTTRYEGKPQQAQMLQHGDWLFISIGSQTVDQVTTWTTETTDKAGLKLIEGNALRLKGDLSPLVQWLSSVSLPDLPSFEAHFKPGKESVRTEASIQLKQAIEMPLPEWQIPTNVVREPLASFSGSRALRPLIASLPGTQKLAEIGFPNQLYSWSRPALITTNSIPLYPAYLGWPISREEIDISNITKHLPTLIGKSMLQSGSARLLAVPERNETIVQVIPTFVQPFVSGFTNNTHGVRVAGLFPLSTMARPAPDGLFSQLNSRENIVYYQWEITQDRISSYKTLLQFVSFIFQKTQSNAKDATFRWLTALEPKMGNAVTLVTANEPTHLELIRKSQIGFTGLELTLLARWLESESFPWIDSENLSEWTMRSFAPPPTAPAPTPTQNASARR